MGRQSKRPRERAKPRPKPERKGSVRLAVLPLLIVGAALVAYANSFSGAFVFDDTHHVLDNPGIVKLWPLGDVIAEARRPVVDLSLAINYALGEFEVAGYHAFNLAIHILAALTLYGVIRRTLIAERLRPRFGEAAPWLALVVALIWVVHPLQTQSVTYVIQRGESLMGLFYLLTLYCVIRGVRSSQRGWWYAAAVVACALGMGSKAVMITAPVVVLAYDWVFLGNTLRETLRRRWPLYLGLAATWWVLVELGIAGGVLSTSRPLAHVGFSYKDITPLEYLGSQPEVILHYLRLSVWPHPLSLDYEWPVARTLWRIVPYAVVMGIALLASVWGWWRRSAWGFVGLWFFAILAPTSSFIPIRDLALEHRMYLSLASVLVFMVIGGYAGLGRAFDRFGLKVSARRVIAVVLVTAIVGVLSVRVHQRNKDYRSELAIWSSAVAVRPDNGRARHNLANALLKAGRFREAIAQSREAIRIRPEHAPSYFDLGAALDQDGRPDEAMETYRETIRLDPTMTRAHLNLGVMLYQRGDTEGAIRKYREVLGIDPEHILAHYNLANALKKQGRIDEAIEAYREVVRIEPLHINARKKLGDALVGQGRVEQGVRVYREALAVNRGNPDLNFRLGIALLQLDRVDDAIAALQQTLRVKPNNEAAQRALAAARARRGG